MPMARGLAELIVREGIPVSIWKDNSPSPPMHISPINKQGHNMIHLNYAAYELVIAIHHSLSHISHVLHQYEPTIYQFEQDIHQY